MIGRKDWLWWQMTGCVGGGTACAADSAEVGLDTRVWRGLGSKDMCCVHVEGGLSREGCDFCAVLAAPQLEE